MSPRGDSSQTRGDKQNPRSKSLIKVPATGANPQSAARLEPRALYPRPRLGTLTASFLRASRGWGAVQSRGTLRGASPGGSRHRAGMGWGTYLAQPAISGPREAAAPARSSTANPPFRGARAAGPPPRLGPSVSSCSERSPVRSARRQAPATGARRRGRGHGGVFLLCPRLRSAPLPPPAAVVSSPHSAPGSGSRARKAPSEVRAEPPARLEIAPRPPGAPPPAWAPPRGGGGRGAGRVGRGSHLNRLFPPGSSRAPRPRALSDSRGPTGGEAGRETPLGAVRRPRGWGWGCPGRRRSPSFPLSLGGTATWLQTAAGALPLPRWVARRRGPGKRTRRHQSGP